MGRFDDRMILAKEEVVGADNLSAIVFAPLRELISA